MDIWGSVPNRQIQFALISDDLDPACLNKHQLGGGWELDRPSAAEIKLFRDMVWKVCALKAIEYPLQEARLRPTAEGGTSVTHQRDAAEWRYGVISCLLYTSPSPRDQRGSRMPSSA